MKLHLFFSISLTFLLTACGGSSSSTDSISSFTELKESLAKSGYSIESLQISPKVQSKVSNNELRITYDANKSILFSSSSLYIITNESNGVVIATVDANATADEVESKTKLLMEQNISKVPIGYVNVNTTVTNASATSKTILAEVETAYKQFTLNNVTAATSVVEGSDLNVSYQTALQNEDKTFTCNAEVKVVDAQKGYTSLRDLSVGEYVCKHGEISLLSFIVEEIPIPSAPSISAPKITYANSTDVNITGEIGASLYFKDANATEATLIGEFPESGKITYAMDTSKDGNNTGEFYQINGSNKKSPNTSITIENTLRAEAQETGTGNGTVTPENISLNINGATVSIADANFEEGTTPTGIIPALDISTVTGDGPFTVTQTLNGTEVETGVEVDQQEGVNTVVYTITETGAVNEENESTTVTETFTRTSVDTIAPNAPTISEIPTEIVDSNITNVTVLVLGEPNATIFVNGVSTGIQTNYNDGEAYIDLALNPGANDFNITLQDNAGLFSPAANVNITRDIETGTGNEGGEIADTIKPVISLTGGSGTSVAFGSTYIYPTATATDNIDGPVDVTITGTVNTAIAGTYPITYTATDAEGNKNITVQIVTVLPEVIPDIETTYSVTYEVQTLPGDINVVLPSSTSIIDGKDDTIEYILVNGERIDVNASTYTFSGHRAFLGTELIIQTKLVNKDISDPITIEPGTGDGSGNGGGGGF